MDAKNYVNRPWTPEEEADFQNFMEVLERNSQAIPQDFDPDFETVDFLFDTPTANC